MDKYGIGSKCIFSKDIEGINIAQRVRCNTNTGHIGITSTEFQKQNGWSGIINNKNCSIYLGVTIAEQALFNVFNHVERMPNNNKGFDFKCNNGYMIDVKSATQTKNWGAWMFTIKYNQIPDYFLCLAFDDRKNLNPKHIWLIPSGKVNNLNKLTISESRLNKWSKYELLDKMDKVIACCNIMKGANYYEQNEY